MSRDTRDDRPPLRASELLPNHVMLNPREPRAVVCPGCGCWKVPHHGRLRRHDPCPESGRRVWFDLRPGEWLARLDAARLSLRRTASLQSATEQAFREARNSQRQEVPAA